MTDSHTLPRSLWLTLAALTLFWGLNWPMMKFALAELPVWTFRGSCVVVGAAGLFVIARVSRLPIRIPQGQWMRIVLPALFNIGLWNVLIGYGVSLLPAGRSAILAYTMPLWTVLISVIALDEKLTSRRIAGVALGMGAVVLLLGTELSNLRTAPVGALMVIGAAMSWAVGTVLIKRYPVALPTTSFVAWQLALGGLPVAIGALVIDWGTWHPISWKPTLGLLYNMFIAFVFCHWAWFKIATNAPAGVASVSTMMIPVIGVLSGMLLLGEQPRWQEYLALVLVTLALATVLIPPRPWLK